MLAQEQVGLNGEWLILGWISEECSSNREDAVSLLSNISSSDNWF